MSIRWVGAGEETPRALAVVYYDPEERVWHIGDARVSREMLENLDGSIAAAVWPNLLVRVGQQIEHFILKSHALKDVTKGW